jgi:DNA-directed RNA polymerase specialized sigma24 family protein
MTVQARRPQELLGWLMANGRREVLCSDLCRSTGAPRPVVEDALQDACLLASRPGGCRGVSEGEVFNYLRAATLRKLRDQERLAHHYRELPVGVKPREGDSLADAAETEVFKRERQRELNELARLAVGELTDPQRKVVALHSHCVPGDEIARRLQLSKRRVKRLKENAYSRARASLVEAAGGGCERGELQVSRLAFGTADEPERYQALEHLQSCQHCLSLYKRLEAFHDRIAGMLPLPVTARTDAGLMERALDKSTGVLWQAKQQLAELAGQAKQQTAAAYTRAVEYTPLASVRPGAAATAIAGCLAIGSGAGYCLERNIDPVGGLVDAIHSAAPGKPQAVSEKRLERRPVREQPPDPPPVPAAPPPAEPVAVPEPQPEPAAPAPSARVPAAAPEPALEPTPPAVQFGEPVSPSAAPAAAAPASPSPKPAPVEPGVDLYGP